jgi:hypothetical protein
MRKAMYGTIIFFVAVLILVAIVAEQHPVRTVKYENGVVSEEAK